SRAAGEGFGYVTAPSGDPISPPPQDERSAVATLTAARLGAMPRGVWALGFVSLFMDISSEMIHGLLPVFLVTVLGASAEMVGLIEGVGEATASMAKLFS